MVNILILKYNLGMKLLSKIKRIIAGQPRPENWREARDLLESDEYKIWLEKKAGEVEQQIKERMSQHRDFSFLQKEKMEILAEQARLKSEIDADEK